MRTHDTHSRASLIAFGIASLLAVGAAGAQVATGTTGIDDSGSFQREVQACREGRTQQDQATCMKEARNAQADKRPGAPPTQASLRANAVARCNVFTEAADKSACEARVLGAGSTEGSVAGGGVIRQVETLVPTTTK